MHPYRIVFLGAGFSKAAGLPLACDLYRDIRAALAVRTNNGYHFRRARREFLRLKRLRTGKPVAARHVDLEELAEFLDVEFLLWLRGSDTWSEDGNQAQLAIKWQMGKILNDAQQRVTEEAWTLYESFVRRLTGRDLVVTFNYDTIVETACERAGVQFRLCPDKYKSVTTFGGGIGDPNDEDVVIAKVHGSLDWFSSRTYETQHEEYRADPQSHAKPYHNSGVWRNQEQLGLVRIAGEPYSVDSEFLHLWRARNIDLFYDPKFPGGFPYMVLPSRAKLACLKPLSEFWFGGGYWGTSNSQLAIIGFSTSVQDDYTAFPLIQAVDNFQNHSMAGEWFQPTQLKVVDFQPGPDDQARFKDERPWIDWSRSRCWWDGFERVDLAELLESPIEIPRSE